jgi:hypothetical protein
VETPYKISVDQQFTTAIEGTHFRLPERTTFKPNAMRDTLAIRFFRTPDLQTQTFRLVLRVESNEYFKIGQVQYAYKVFLVNDRIAQPDWWSSATNYLGVYSDLKYQTLIDVTGIADMTGFSPSEIRAYALQLKYYLEQYKLDNGGEPLTENNGDPVTVPING